MSRPFPSPAAGAAIGAALLLVPHSTYVLHVGGGMRSNGGGEMGPGWQSPNGTYGMEFVFTTG